MPKKRLTRSFAIAVALSLFIISCSGGNGGGASEGGANETVNWECGSDSKVEAGMYYVIGTAVESTQSAGNITFKADGSFEAFLTGAGRTPNADLAGKGEWKVSPEDSKKFFELNFSEWTSWEGTDDSSPTSFKGELESGHEACVFSGLRLCDQSLPCSSEYWLITTK